MTDIKKAKSQQKLNQIKRYPIKINALLLILILSGCTPSNIANFLEIPYASRKAKPANLAFYSINNSGTTIDCQGKAFNEGKRTEVRITSTAEQKTKDITIKNCKIRGSIRIIGLGRNSESSNVRKSSQLPNHTHNAQRHAPTNISLENLEIEAVGPIPLYIGPGSTKVNISNSKFTGQANSTVIYLDSESALNTIQNNNIDVKTRYRHREAIAIDGSAYNLISDNTFKKLRHGGIYIYRNCGESGTIRHQKPQFNIITRNEFRNSFISPFDFAIWVGSREGRRLYCHEDDGQPMGSSASNLDHAFNNYIANNKFESTRNSIKYSNYSRTKQLTIKPLTPLEATLEIQQQF